MQRLTTERPGSGPADARDGATTVTASTTASATASMTAPIPPVFPRTMPAMAGTMDRPHKLHGAPHEPHGGPQDQNQPRSEAECNRLRGGGCTPSKPRGSLAAGAASIKLTIGGAPKTEEAARAEAEPRTEAAPTAAGAPTTEVDPPTAAHEVRLNLERDPPSTSAAAAGLPAANPQLLLTSLLDDSARPCTRPVVAHAQRLSSGGRGVGLPLLRALRALYAERGGLRDSVADVCKRAGCATSVCALTASTGLSLAESVVLAGERAAVDTSALVGPALLFFSYSWTGTLLADMLDAVERALERLRAESGVDEARLFVWIDLFCASQNLLAGAFLPADASERRRLKDERPAEYRACKEDTDRIFDDALAQISVMVLYLAPLHGKWDAPRHPYLDAERGEPPAGWVREGPVAPTRAWCLFEVSTALAAGVRLMVELSPADRAELGRTLRTRPTSLDATLEPSRAHARRTGQAHAADVGGGVWGPARLGGRAAPQRPYTAHTSRHYDSAQETRHTS